MKLHDLQQRKLEATVSLVESGLDRVERLLSDYGQKGIVRTFEDTLSAEERAALLEKVYQLRGELHVFAQRFGLQRHPVDIQQVLNAELSSVWVMLENCRPNRMKGYGVEFDPEVRKALEESLERLLSQVIAVRAKLRPT